MPRGFPKNGINNSGFRKGHKINLGKKYVLGKHWKVKDTSKYKGRPKGFKLTEEQKKERSKRMMGHKSWGGNGSLGKHWKIKDTSKMHKFEKGKKHPNWNNGSSFFPYSIDWTNELRISIREKDKYTCQLCGEKQGDRAFSIHHIDYNKENCNINNLITLCLRCHLKTNKNRNYWIKYFSQFVERNLFR